jgi:peptidoglycan/xylan/chitin deacetylase (PgdA/CDA1 family)
MATQSIIQQNNSLALSKGPTSMSAGSTATDRRDYDTAVPKSVTETSPNSEQSDEGESLPATASSNQASGEQSSSKETQAQAEGTQAEGSQTQTEGSQTQSDESQSQLTGSQSAAESSSSPSGTPQMPAARTQSTTGIQVAGIMSEDLLPTPSPGSSETPVHSYYDANGNPPTAPGLAMRPRQFQPENGKMVYLTFDDGPYPSTTLKILAILAKENVQGTFFDVGHQVELNPDLLKAEYEQGNAIGNHTYSHNMAEVYKSPQAFLSDVKKAEDIIYNTIGIRPQIVRAPGGTVGNFNINYFNAVDAAGYLMEDWNVDSGDTDARLVPEAQLIHNVEQQIQGKSRVVILMHDLVGKSTTIQALPIIIEMLRKQDFAFGMLGSHVRPIVFPEGLHN